MLSIIFKLIDFNRPIFNLIKYLTTPLENKNISIDKIEK